MGKSFSGSINWFCEGIKDSSQFNLAPWLLLLDEINYIGHLEPPVFSMVEQLKKEALNAVLDGSYQPSD